MYSKVLSSHVIGINAVPVEVEVDIGNVGLPSFTVVGLAEGAVKESKERVRAALKNISFQIFNKPITINLAPADFKKDGSHYDLPIAIGLITALDPTKYDLNSTVIIGELALDGSLRGVSGVLCMVASAAEMGVMKVIVPTENLQEASLVIDIDVWGFDHISDVISHLAGKDVPKLTPNMALPTKESNYLNFSDVKGQHTARRAAEIAAAGMHNLIMIGSPGSGKTMIARRIPSIMPPMALDEALLTTKIHSVAGLLRQKGKLVSKRPFVAPHHTASNVAIVGGGAKVLPGHVSIATNGVLFLDEMLEFNRSVLEVLRQPLEDGYVTIARAGKTVTYPANFMLIAACNPCPCGYSGDNKRECKCSSYVVERYRSKLSGPLLDRIDLHVQLLSVDHKELQKAKGGESSESIRNRVIKAHEIQRSRFASGRKILFNSQMQATELQKYCKLEDKTLSILSMAMERFGLSARSYNKILRVSRTIADLAGSTDIKAEHLTESLQYRMLDER